MTLLQLAGTRQEPVDAPILIWVFLVIAFILLILNVFSATGLLALRVLGRDIFYHFEWRKATISADKIITLEKYFRFYNNLDEADKKIFESRVERFIRKKRFETREDLELTEEMKTIIAACAIQVSFGLRNYLYDRFNRIILYPKSFYSENTNTYNIGEVNVKGVIVLSWYDFIKGYQSPDDGLNVGIHEMAHALSFQNIIEQDLGYFFEKYYQKWNDKAIIEWHEMQDSGSAFFRDYAKTNIHEFFAVSVERFFENPVEFQNQEPKLYDALRRTLNQNPAALSIDRNTVTVDR